MATLPFVTLGSTNFPVSALGLGMAALGRPGYINLGHADDLAHNYENVAMESHAHAVLDAAWQAGIRYFDVARSYGHAETFLGRWLVSRNIDPTQVTVGSKWGYTYTAEWQVHADKHEVKEHTLPVLRRQWQESQQHLASYLRLYQVHSATLESGILNDSAVLSELAHYKATGVAIGLSLSGVQQAVTLYRALDVTIDGVSLFDCVQATWNLLERSAGKALAEAHAAGLGVIIKEALANGRLTLRNQDPVFKAKRVQLLKQAERLQTRMDALVLAAVLAQPWVSVVLSGAATIAQIHSNVDALAVHWDAEADRVLEELVDPPDVYWATRSQLAWN